MTVGTVIPSEFEGSALALFLASPVLTVVQPRLRSCRPILARTAARRLAAGAVLGSALLIAAGAALDWGGATAATHAQHVGRGTRAAPPESETKVSATNKPVVEVGANRFVWSGRVGGLTSQDAWFPAMSTEGARLEIKGRAVGGAVFVQLMDGRAVVVYEETFASLPADGVSVDVPGASGVWMVSLGFSDFGGDLRVGLGPRGGHGPGDEE